MTRKVSVISLISLLLLLPSLQISLFFYSYYSKFNELTKKVSPLLVPNLLFLFIPFDCVCFTRDGQQPQNSSP